MTKSQKGYSELQNSIDNAVFNGSEYVSGHTFFGLGTGTNANVYLENPAGSGKVLVAQSPAIWAAKRVNVRLDFNPTVDTPGTEDPPKNRRSDVANGSVANAFHSGSYTLNDPFEDIPVGSAQGVSSTYGSSSDRAAFAIAPGDGALLQATTTQTDTDLRLTFDFVELPDGVID